MTEHYIGDLDEEDKKLVRREIKVQEDSIVELAVVTRMSYQFLEGNISLETMEAAIYNMALMADYEHMAVDEL